MYEKGIFSAHDDVDDIKLEYDYIVSDHIDGNAKSEACHTYSRHQKAPFIISQGLRPADFAGNHVWPYNWHFQYLTKDQKSENNAINIFKRMTIAGPAAAPSQDRPKSSSTARFTGGYGGRIEVRIARAITSGRALPRSEDYWRGKVFDQAADESSDVNAIDATHCVSSMPGRDINMPCRNFTDPDVRNIDPHTHPYATFVFHYRDGAILEEKGIKGFTSSIASVEPTVLGKQKLQLPNDDENGHCEDSDAEEVEYLLHRSLNAAYRPQVNGEVQAINHAANTATSPHANDSFTFRCKPAASEPQKSATDVTLGDSKSSQEVSNLPRISSLTLPASEHLQEQTVCTARRPLISQHAAFTASLTIRNKRRKP